MRGAESATCRIMWSVFFIFLSYLDTNVINGDLLSGAFDAEKEGNEVFSTLNGTMCAKMLTVGENFLYMVSDGAEAVRSVVSPTGMLVDCSVIVNQMQVKSFMRECRLGLKERSAGQQMEARFAHMDEAKLMCWEFKKRAGKDSGEDSAGQQQVLMRSKRGFTYPGTLWCGAGNMADSYDQLGEFAETDSCCRVHDHCPHVIHAFSSNYGYTNFKWHSICHCDCDNALKDCLRKVNDTSSRVVGQAFFNVIGVPCFEFAYEEQCVERHWYGLCKRYEKLPVAVVREPVPYDFGGIDIIDELTVAPPKSKNSKKSKEEENPESATQSTMSGPEEPSLRNVVTAAEDFIKVLATVSTSQSSSADSDKGEEQSSEKKKRKNTGKKKKTNKKQKGKGKGKAKKRKLKAEAGVKTEEGAAVTPSGNKAEVKPLTNFISESQRYDQLSRSTNRVDESEFEFQGKGEPFNEVMKDEPAVDKETVSITSPATVQKKPAELVAAVLTEEVTPSTSTTVPHEAKTRRERKRRRKKSKEPLLFSPKDLVANTAEDLSLVSVPTIITITPPVQPEQQSFGSDTETRPVVNTPIVISKVKRNRSKEREVTEGRKKRRKVSSVSPIVPVAQQNSFLDNLKVIPLTGVPTTPSIPTAEYQLSHRLDVHAGNIQVTASNTSFRVLKRQKLKERGLRNRRRKAGVPLSTEIPLFSYNNFETALPVLTTPDTRVALNSPERTAAVEETPMHGEWGLSAAAAIDTKRQRQANRQQRKPRKKAVAFGDGFSAAKQTDSITFIHTPSNAATTEEFRSEEHSTTTLAPLDMSPLQLSIERAKAHFTRKKRRKMRHHHQQ